MSSPTLSALVACLCTAYDDGAELVHQIKVWKNPCLLHLHEICVPNFAIRQREGHGRLINKTLRPMTSQHMNWSFH